MGDGMTVAEVLAVADLLGVELKTNGNMICFRPVPFDERLCFSTTGPTVLWIIKPQPRLRPVVLTPFGLRPHSVSTTDQPETLSFTLVLKMGYSQ